MRKAIYPGSFDPIHKGHINIIKKASELFDKVFVVVSNNPEKEDQSPLLERFELVSKSIDIDNVEVIVNDHKLTVDIAKQNGAKWIVRSGRNDIDFKYELELAAANKHISKDIETILIYPDFENVEYQSRLIKQGVKDDSSNG